MYNPEIREIVEQRFKTFRSTLHPYVPDRLTRKTITYSQDALTRQFDDVVCYLVADSRGVESPWVTFEQAKALAEYHNSNFEGETIDYDPETDVWRCGDKDNDRFSDYFKGVDVDGFGHIYPWCWNRIHFVAC